ncbi:hypothetical protein N7454_010631 [Penicillium verhagenii]|nr:hypothetical protein N7454_010631 [Penicillium verhagenii]
MQSMATNDHLFEPPRSKTYIPGHISPSHFQLPDMSDLGIQGVMAPAYQSLFAPGQEIPRLMNVTYRWWEDEATTVLWAFNIPEICTLIRYALFRDEELPRQALLSRNAETIDAFLVSLADTWEHRYLSNLSHLQRVEEVLRRLRIPPLREVHWSWFPPRHSVEPRNIAFAIELESHCQFMRMHFEDIVRAALGYSAPSVDWFLQQHTALYIHLLDHLTIYPEQIPTYIEAEKYLRSGSPFAYRAIVQCLHTLLPDAALNLRLPTKPGLEFITTPIQKLFLENPP